MRNKLQISESEVKRILSLHKGKINEERKTVKEEYVDPGQTTGHVAASAAAGAGVGAGIGTIILPGVGTAVGAVLGTGVGALTGWLTAGGGYSERTYNAFKFCVTNKDNLGKPINSDEQLRDIADNIRAAVSGVGTDEVLIAKNLRKLKSIPDLCRLNVLYAKRYNERLFATLDGDIDMEDDWRDFVWKPISELAENTKKIDNTQVKENAKKCGWGDDVEGYKNSKWRCPKDKNKISDVEENARKCGWGSDVKGYKDSGWRCPKDKDTTPIPGGGGYEIDYQKIMDAIKQKCVSSGGGGKDDDFSLDWSAIGQGEKIDKTMNKDSINKLFND